MNNNPGPTTVNNNKIPLINLPFPNCDKPTILSECHSSYCYKEDRDFKWKIFEKRAFIFNI